MKLSEVRPCDNCGHALAPSGNFYVVRTSLALVSPKAYRELVGLSLMLGNNIGLAEVMGPEPHVIKIAGDENKELLTEFLLCVDCYTQPVILAQLDEVVQQRKESNNA